MKIKFIQKENGKALGRHRVQETSRWRVWWLVNVRGYRVITQSIKPSFGWFGRLRYVERFVLEPVVGGDQSQSET